ncbi:MAG: hypothetical protein BWY80_01396 [Firmicutes bacterium ADurb.Bin456]|nr:MAG: hypothetical protein BWY80_01396 [Firmicutes bacterium ADurb.Bin456]
MEIIDVQKKSDGLNVTLRAVPMGADWCVAITGGEIPHLGAVALGVPRPSLQDSGRTSATVSVLTLTGHKEDEIARPAAYFLASRLKTPVVVSCGIHNDQIEPGTIRRFVELVQEGLNELALACGRLQG